MKASELRIGNFVSNPPLSEFRVIDHLDIRDHAESRLIQPFEPIPLTEEWLKRFGFEQGDNVIHNDCFWGINVGSSNLGINPNNGVVWITTPAGHPFNNPALVPYVHQLQNLYFCLTGQELTLAPPQR